MRYREYMSWYLQQKIKREASWLYVSLSLHLMAITRPPVIRIRS
jgi:hypothetical protein